MKLITFQPVDVLKKLEKTGILQSNPVPFIDMQKYQIPYDYIIQKMLKKRIKGFSGEKYPIWAWAKCGNSICPKKRKNLNHKKQNKVKITFIKPDNEVLLSDYMAYSCILSGHIVPRTKNEYEKFLKDIKSKNITLDNLKAFVRSQKTNPQTEKEMTKIQKTWGRIFDLKSNVHQACVWHIKFDEIQKIEILNDDRYLYGALNTPNAKGIRPDWKKRYLKFLP